MCKSTLLSKCCISFEHASKGIVQKVVWKSESESERERERERGYRKERNGNHVGPENALERSFRPREKIASFPSTCLDRCAAL